MQKQLKNMELSKSGVVMHVCLFRARWQQARAWPHVQFSSHQMSLSDLSVRANTPPSPSVFTHRENTTWFSPVSSSLESELHFLLESIPFPLGVIWIPVLAFVPRAGPVLWWPVLCRSWGSLMEVAQRSSITFCQRGGDLLESLRPSLPHPLPDPRMLPHHILL